MQHERSSPAVLTSLQIGKGREYIKGLRREGSLEKGSERMREEMSATVPQARKQSPIQKGNHMGLGKTLLQIRKNIQRAAPASWEHGAGVSQGS